MASRSSVHHPDTTEGLVQTLDPCTGRRGCLDTMETMKMSYELLKTITGNFSKDNILGSGTFGVVYKGVLNGKEIAVKILRDMAALDDNAFRNEFQNLARLDHRNIVQLVGYCNESEKQTVERDDGTEVIAEKMHVALCFQYVENGSLHKHISDEYQGLHWHIRYKIIKGICEGLKHLRVGLESPVLHLDLKPENILLDKEMVPKIADFGLSRLIGEERTKQTINSVGTCGYWPPEYVKFQLLSEAFDIFSLGVIITKIMIGNEGYHSFADMLPRKLVKHVHNNWKKRLQETIEPTSLELEAYYCQQVKTCIKMASKCLSEDRKERPSIQEIVCALIEAEIMMQNIPLQIEKVLGKWRKRLEATLTGRHLLIVDIYCNQVKKCIEIALECVEADRQRRPSIGHIVNALDETENRIHEAESEWNDEDSRSSYTKNSSNRPYMTRNYSYKLLREITNDFSEDRLIGRGGSGNVYKGVNEDGREIAVKILHFNGFSGVDTEHFQNEVYSMGMIQHENVVRLVGYCDETEKLLVEHHGRVVLADKIHRALCFEYLQNGSLTKHISSDECDGLDWCRLYKILKGICDGLRYLHEELPISPILHLDLKPSHILLDENMVPKISDFTLSRCLQEGHTVVTSSIYGTPGYRPPEFINKGIISVKSDIYSLGVTIIYMLTGRRGYTIEDEIISQEFMEDVFKNWRRRLQESLKGRSLEGYCQQVKKCIEIASQCVEGDRHKRPNIGAIVRMLDETETMIMVHDAGKLLDVHPMELRFPLKPKRFASSLLRLRNKEDHHVAFRLVSKGQKMYHTNLPLLGIVPPKCTCTIALRMSNQQKRPQLDGNEGLLVQSVAVSRQQCLDQASVVREFQSHFNKAQESDDDEVQEQEVALEFVSSPPTEEASSKIITAPDAQEVSSIEVHPKEPWIMTTHERGNFRIWNYQTLAILNPIRLPEESVYVAKFIAREEWIVAGDGNGCIHVFGYDEYQDTTSFEAHNGQIMSLAVHPKNSYVLSSSHEDHLIKLWHWDKYWDFEKGPWVCTRTFEGHSNKVSHVIFNPDGTDSFASASWDGTVKIWDWGLNSDVCNTITLDTHADGLLCIDYITGADPQHLITGSKDQTAQIWDLKIKRCREFLQGHAHHVSVVYCHQELHKLFTGSLDGTVRIWDSMTYRLENIIALNLGAVSDVGYIDELQRIVVGCHKGIAMMEIKI
ncbi:receptor like protein kinase S.2-like isoform X4 [Miscanthus floridulus]|uniref:receptor like protein kinase S.2-like isoform X4 n=1 Tax=Miscanthus floridulus TaxID=154761 RepID=UPI00345A9553